MRSPSLPNATYQSLAAFCLTARSPACRRAKWRTVAESQNKLRARPTLKLRQLRVKKTQRSCDAAKAHSLLRCRSRAGAGGVAFSAIIAMLDYLCHRRRRCRHLSNHNRIHRRRPSRCPPRRSKMVILNHSHHSPREDGRSCRSK